jgi:hypothetical protein
MEITWRYAWAFFLSLLILNRPFPLPETLAVFTMASLVTTLAGKKNWRIYQSLALHIFGFTMAALLTTYRLYFQHTPFFSLSWMKDLFKQLQEPQQWLLHLLVLACLLLFWLGARAMVKRPQNYYPVCLQFDKGLGAIFLLLLIKFLVQEKGGVLLEDPVTRYLLFAFFTLKEIDSAAAVYAGMLRWGRRSGLPVVLSETPIEYGSRLSHHFPELKEEIEMIIETFNMEVYGNIVVDGRLLSRILSAQHKMRSPRHWLARLRGWFVQQPSFLSFRADFGNSRRCKP